MYIIDPVIQIYYSFIIYIHNSFLEVSIYVVIAEEADYYFYKIIYYIKSYSCKKRLFFFSKQTPVWEILSATSVSPACFRLQQQQQKFSCKYPRGMKKSPHRVKHLLLNWKIKKKKRERERKGRVRNRLPTARNWEILQNTWTVLKDRKKRYILFVYKEATVDLMDCTLTILLV